MSTIATLPSDSNEITHVLRGESLPSAVHSVKKEASSETQQAKLLPSRETLRIDAVHELVDALKAGFVAFRDLPVELEATEGGLANARHRSYVDQALEAANYTSLILLYRCYCTLWKWIDFPGS